jgi:hypothetical protein
MVTAGSALAGEPNSQMMIDYGHKSRAQDASSSAAHLSAPWLPHILALATVGYWLLAKSVLFHRLEYCTDLFTNLELTRTFFEGRPLLWENAYGNHKAFHNYYLAPLLYPLTRFLGAYGLFVIQAFFAGWSVYAILGRARDAPVWKRNLYWAMVAAIGLGPIAFWIFDDVVFGFHYELLFVPLSVLFALSLSERRKSAWLFAGLMVLTREEGAILTWCIHVLHEVMNVEAGTDPRARAAMLQRLMRITLGWLFVFSVGMGLLLLMGGANHGRLGGAIPGLRAVLEDRATRSYFFASLVDTALLLGAGSLIYLTGIPARGLVASALISMVLVVPTTVASSVYKTSVREHGIAWPPRFSLFWSVALAGCLFAIERAQTPAFAAWRRRRAAVAIVVAGSIVAQIAVLGVRKRYDFVSRISLQTLVVPASMMALVVPESTLQAYLRRPRFVAAALSDSEDSFLTCLGRDLPHETAITATGGLLGRFHQQDVLWADRVAVAWKPPEIVVCDETGRIPWEDGCLKLSRSLPEASYNALHLGNLSVRYASGPKSVVEACAARAVPEASPGQG